ncbi:NAD(P)/FAD-dependent oxidoreductase [Rhodococcoides navarretei]|uniref:FAD-dependent oxidoreductase n=1 Tax=Rhodococcus navarretei TaxID=3128981 RepID=A0ABU9CQA3_9NOCA
MKVTVQSELSGLSKEARAALAARIAKHLSQSDTPRPDHDVVIVGGGVAGLTLALEISRTRPTRVLVVDSDTGPAPEATHRVGESTVEVASHYLREKLCMGEHLTASQLPKMGLRMFFSDGVNTDIAQRLEVGSSTRIPFVTYQIDRGRLANELARRCAADGVDITCGRVQSIELGAGSRPHSLTVRTGDRTFTTTATWVVDGSGRNRTLSKQLDLRRSNEHKCNAVWLRVAAELDIGQWSSDPDWHARIVDGDRALSTNHLMGQGYWVWIIRLASGSTSIGIVADPAFHQASAFDTLSKATAWLREYEPQCADALAEVEDRVQDFRVMKNYSHGAAKFFDGKERWCLTGDSAIFLDPLYSSGLDLIAIGNGLITDMIVRDLDGENVIGRSKTVNTLFGTLAEMWLAIYQDQYPLMAAPKVMTSKIIWDVALYWGFLGFLYVNDRFVTVADDPSIVPGLERMVGLSNRMQQFFREWAAIEQGRPQAQFVDAYSPLNFMRVLHATMIDEIPDVTAQFDTNAELLGRVAGQLVELIIAENCNRFSDDAVMRQIQAWQQDPLLRDVRSVYRRQQGVNPLSTDWIIASAPVQSST